MFETIINLHNDDLFETPTFKTDTSLHSKYYILDFPESNFESKYGIYCAMELPSFLITGDYN